MDRRRVLTQGKRVTSLGLPPEVAKLLDDAGFRTGYELQHARPRDIMVLGFGPVSVRSIFERVGLIVSNSILCSEYRKAKQESLSTPAMREHAGVTVGNN
jgi:hypothetical protein